jgi:hypothetical protein
MSSIKKKIKENEQGHEKKIKMNRGQAQAVHSFHQFEP